MALDIKTASELASLIPSYDGNPAGMKSFNDSISLVQTIVPQAQQAAAIQLVLTKLTGKARDLFTAVPATYQEIKDKISRNCVDKCSSDLALANLKNIKPRKGQETIGFTKEIDQLTDKLKQAYVREEVPNEVASKLANKAAIQSLIAVSAKQETKMLLKIGKFDSLSEALNIVVENENFNTDQTATMLQMNKTKYRPNDGRSQTERFNGNYSRGNFRNFPRFNQRPNFNRPNFNQPPNRFHSRGGYHNTNNNQYQSAGRQRNWNQSNNRRIFQVNDSVRMPQIQFQGHSVPIQQMQNAFTTHQVTPNPLMMQPNNQQQPQQQQTQGNFLGNALIPFPCSR